MCARWMIFNVISIRMCLWQKSAHICNMLLNALHLGFTSIIENFIESSRNTIPCYSVWTTRSLPTMTTENVLSIFSPNFFLTSRNLRNKNKLPPELWVFLQQRWLEHTLRVFINCFLGRNRKTLPRRFGAFALCVAGVSVFFWPIGRILHRFRGCFLRRERWSKCGRRTDGAWKSKKTDSAIVKTIAEPYFFFC